MLVAAASRVALANALVHANGKRKYQGKSENSGNSSEPRDAVFVNNETHRRNQDDRWHFIEQAIRGGRPRGFVAFDVGPNPMPNSLIHEQESHKTQFDMEPRLSEIAWNVIQHANAKRDSEYRGWPCDGQPETSLHDAKLVDERIADGTRALVLSLAVVDKQTKHVKQPSKPRHHEDDVQGLEKRVRHLQYVWMHIGIH